jgi:hypothetical protein
MTRPSDVPEGLIIVESIGDKWVVVSEDQPVERFGTRAEAIARADQIVTARPMQVTIIIKPAPGPFQNKRE